MAITDYPEADIKAHRSNAKMLRILGALMFFLGSGAAFAKLGPGYGAAAVAISALMFNGATSMRLQALKWELEENEVIE